MNNDNNFLTIYKPAKTTEEMINYLEENKRVVYTLMGKDEAKEILLKYNYINVITPFKHVFARKEKNEVIKDKDGNHIYDRDVEFLEYYNLFKDEIRKYPVIYSNISIFESYFKSIVSYHIVNNLRLNNSDELLKFIEQLKSSVYLLNSKEFNQKRKTNMIKQLNEMEGYVFKYHDIYCFFDRLSLGCLLTVFVSLNINLQKLVFCDLTRVGINLNSTNTSQFISRTFTLINIRNCIAHNNSLEILVRFYNTKEKYLRKPRDRKRYLSLIKYLEKEKRFTIK